MSWILGLLLLVTYVPSVLWCRKEIIKFHKELTFVNPNLFDVIVSLIPVFNLAGAIMLSIQNGSGKKVSDRFFGSK